MDRVFLFHIIPLSWLPSVLKEGALLSPQKLAHRGLWSPQHDLALPLKRRQKTKLPAPPHGDLSEYISLYIAKPPAQLTQATSPPPAQWIYLITELERLRAHSLNFIIADGDPRYFALTRFYPAAHSLNVLDWPLLQSPRPPAAFHPQDPDAHRRYAATILVRSMLPLSAINGWAVADSDAERLARDLLTKHQDPHQILVRPEWF